MPRELGSLGTGIGTAVAKQLGYDYVYQAITSAAMRFSTSSSFSEAPGTLVNASRLSCCRSCSSSSSFLTAEACVALAARPGSTAYSAFRASSRESVSRSDFATTLSELSAAIGRELYLRREVKRLKA